MSLPSKRNANVSVRGPNHFNEQVKGTRVLNDLAPGLYTVAAKSIHLETESLAPTVSQSPVAVEAGTVASVTVDYGNVVPDTTKVIDAPAVTQVSGPPGGDQAVRFGATSQPDIAVGDVLMIGVGPQTPNGFLGRVTSITRRAGEVVAATTPASLFDAITSGSFSIDAPLPPIGDQTAPASLSKAITKRSLSAAALRQPISVKRRCGAFDLDISASFALTSDWHFDLKWGSRGLDHGRLVFSGAESASMSTRISGGAICAVTVGHLLTDIPLRPITILIGPYPIVVGANLNLEASAEANTTLGLESSLSQHATFAFGINYRGGQVTAVNEFNHEWGRDSFANLDDALAGSLTAGIGPTLEVLFFQAIKGPIVSTRTPELSLRAAPFGCPRWTLSGAFRAGMSFTNFPGLFNFAPRVLFETSPFILKQHDAHMYLTPSSGRTGTLVTVIGCAFASGELVDIRLGERTVATAVARTDGIFSAGFAIPDDAGPGPLVVTAKRVENTSPTATLTVLPVLPPILIAPQDAAIIPQNNPSSGCPLNPTRGRGIKLDFEWAADPQDTEPPAHYDLVVEHPGFNPVFSGRVDATHFQLVQCGTFVADANISGWQWRVRQVDGHGRLSAWSTRSFSFAPCRLADSTPCHVAPPG